MSAESDREDAVPFRLFRYSSVNYAELIITQSLLFFSSPRDFNDPFDCQINLPVEASPLAYRSYAQQMLRKNKLGLNRQERRTLAVKMGRREYEEAFSRTSEQISSRAGLVCFSETDDDILLWSHYAEKHSGVCLEFAVRQDELLKDNTSKVHYSNKYPDLNFLNLAQERETTGDLTEKQHRDLKRALYLTKSKHWAYEKEWRTIKLAPKSQSFRGQHSFSSRALTGMSHIFRRRGQGFVMDSL